MKFLNYKTLLQTKTLFKMSLEVSKQQNVKDVNQSPETKFEPKYQIVLGFFYDSLFTTFLTRVLPTSRMVYYSGKPLESMFYC